MSSKGGSGGGASSGRGQSAGGSGGDAAQSLNTSQREAFADDRANAKWRDGLTDKQQSAFRSYSGMDYTDINEFLRKGATPSYDMRDMKAQIRALDQGLAKAKLGRSVMTYRALTHASIYNQLASGKIKSGAIYRDKGYLSTSIDRGLVKKYARGDGGKHGVLMRIKVPKGSKAGYLGHERVSGLSFEKELLLPRNSSLKIGKIKRTREGVIVVNATLIS